MFRLSRRRVRHVSKRRHLDSSLPLTGADACFCATCGVSDRCGDHRGESVQLREIMFLDRHDTYKRPGLMRSAHDNDTSCRFSTRTSSVPTGDTKDQAGIWCARALRVRPLEATRASSWRLRPALWSGRTVPSSSAVPVGRFRRTFPKSTLVDSICLGVNPTARDLSLWPLPIGPQPHSAHG